MREQGNSFFIQFQDLRQTLSAPARNARASSATNAAVPATTVTVTDDCCTVLVCHHIIGLPSPTKSEIAAVVIVNEARQRFASFHLDFRHLADTCNLPHHRTIRHTMATVLHSYTVQVRRRPVPNKASVVRTQWSTYPALLRSSLRPHALLS